MFNSKQEPFKDFGKAYTEEELEDKQQRIHLNKYLERLGSVPKEDSSLEKTMSTDDFLVEPFVGRDYLKEAEQKDREMYIEFFGTVEEKEALRLEKEEAKNKEVSDALRLEDEKKKAMEKEKLELEMQEKAKLLAEELEIKRKAEEILKEKDLAEKRNMEEAQKIIGNYVKMLNEIEPLLEKLKEVPKDYWTSDELRLVGYLDEYVISMNKGLVTLKGKDVSTSFDEEIKLHRDFSMFFNEYVTKATKLRKKVDYLVNRTYPVDVSLKLDKALYAILDYLFDYMENKVVDKSLVFKIKQESLDIYGVASRYTIQVIKTVSDNDSSLTNTVIKIEFNSPLERKSVAYQFMNADYKNKKLDENFELFFVETISKQWHDYTLYNEKEKLVGIKNKFIEQAKLYIVRDNLDSWKI